MPQNSTFIATKTVAADVWVFDWTKHPSKPPSDGKCTPDIRLTGHKKEGYGLSWSPLKTGYLLSGADDALICMWDINSAPKERTIAATQTFAGHAGIVEVRLASDE